MSVERLKQSGLAPLACCSPAGVHAARESMARDTDIPKKALRMREYLHEA
jgi:hypothetical protein